MPFVSNAQRKYLWATHPEVAREFAAATPKGTKLPEHVKDASVLGTARALERFGFKRAGEELRLKIPDRTFHGWDAAHKNESERGQKKLSSAFGDRRNSESLAELLSMLDDPDNGAAQTASKNPLDRSTAWGPPSSSAAGDAASRMSGMSQPSGFGGV